MADVFQGPRSSRRRSGGLLLAAVATVAAAGAWAAPARADEDDWQVAARAGFASVSVDGRDPFGPRLALDGQYGLSDAWAVRLTAAGSRHGVSQDMAKGLPGGAVWAYSTFAGLSYTMDILRLRPSFEVGLGLLGLTGAVKQPGRSVGMVAGIAADYLLGPRWSIGGMVEYVYAPFDLLTNALKGTAVPQGLAVSVRLCWTIR